MLTGPLVIKVGGSLLEWSGLVPALCAYLESRAPDPILLIVGGGSFADALRDLDRIHGLGEARSHALALGVLGLTAHVLASLVPGLSVVEDLATLPSVWSLGRTPILAPRKFLDDEDRSANPLPHAWATTSDTIAARVANRLGARELILLKSVSIPPGLDLEAVSRQGWVDPEFPSEARLLTQVSFVNLRESLARGSVVP